MTQQGQMVTALAQLHDALREVRLPLALPGVGEHLTARGEMVDQLQDYVIPRVLTADGERVDTDEASVDGAVVTVPLEPDLPDGGYLVTYRIISADSHPVQGAWSFVVGEGELVAADAHGLRATSAPQAARPRPTGRVRVSASG